MKKKVLAFLLASTMVIEPFSVASAADFSDGMGQDTVQFSDDAEDVPEVENDDVDQFDTDAVGEGENSSKPSEDAIQMGDDVWFRFDDSTGTATISGKGDMWDYYKDGYDKSGNHKNPFIGMSQSSVKNIIIENGVTSVGDYFLYEYTGSEREDSNVISNIVLGKDIKRIGCYAFTYCYKAKDVILPEGIYEIGDEAFRSCSNFKEIVIPDSIKILGNGCFSNCRNLSSVILPDNLESIPDRAFSACNSLTEITLPPSLETLGSNAFSGCRSLTQITLPSNLKTLGVEAFFNCNSLTEITLPASLQNIEDDGFDSSGAFANCTNLKKVNFEEGFSVNIPGEMFANCGFLTGISIPENVPYIGFSVFSNCNRLTTIRINGAKTKISSNAFRDCKNLNIIESFDCSYAKKIAEENSIPFISSLGEGTHQWLAEKEVIKEPTCTEKGIKAYRCEICGATKKEEEIPAYHHDWDDGVVTKQATETEEGEIQYTCRRCNETKTEPIPKLPKQEDKLKVTGLGMKWLDHNSVELKFQSNIKGTYYIEKVKRGENAPKIDITQAGTLIEANTTVTAKVADLPEDEVDIYVCIVSESDESNYGTVMFQPISSERPRLIASTIKFGDNITAYIEDDTIIFSGNGTIYDTDDMDIGDAEDIWWGNGIDKRKIKHVIFKEDGGAITRIGNYLLGSFENLKDVKLPNGLLEIGEGAFFDCNNLMNIDLPEKVRLVERSAFSNTGISAINWPKNATSIPDGAFVYTNLKEFTVPEGVTEINLQAFYGCTDLIKISIPRSVTYIGSDVFANCRNLTIYGFRDSAAEAYAKANTIKFVSADYKVIFKENGRTKKTEYVTEGENATPPTLKEKPGYTLSWDADYTNIQEDMVINAVWTKKDNGGGNTTIIVSPSETNKYTVTFKDRGKIVKTEKVKSGDAAEYPYINRNGYELSWDKDFSKVTANITVNAVWTVIKPEKVTSLVAEADKKSIALSWDETEYTSYYLVYRKADGETEYTQVAKTTKVLWTDSKAVPGTQYSYKVVAVRSLSGKKYQGAESDVVTTKIGTPQIGDTYSVGDLNYKLTGTKEVTVTGLAKVTDTLVIPSSVTISGKVYKVTAIQDKAFYRNEDIVNVTIGNNVVNVGKYAFYQCSGLETVKFGKRVAIINTCAFTQCPNLENVTLPSSIRKIGAKAFYQCTSIKIFKINGSVLEYVGKKGLAVNKSVTLKLPKKVYTRYKKLIKASNIYSKTKFTKF